LAYKGKYRPINYKKYKGDPTNVTYRSLWERKFMIWCDKNPSVMEWGSEELVIPYISPVDQRGHRYFPDFYMKLKNVQGVIERYIIEIKPKYQVVGPNKAKAKRTKRYLNEVKTFAVNRAKWKAAQNYCELRQMKFKILTEKELGIK
tara:strand:+ start:1340 stop:1780 length:441 start_codon:yes stop_codon:yes gene_type:complete